MSFTFRSRFGLGAALPAFDQDAVKNEPMFFRATGEYAEEHGGPITKAFLKSLRADDVAPAAVLIDTRSHMLMPGMWPCIPGWHHDDIPRTRSDGQPDYLHMTYHAKFALALINGDVSPTNFAVGSATVSEVPVGRKVYQEWDGQVARQIADGTLERVAAPSNRLIYFDYAAFHEGTEAVKRGWRWFGRATWSSGQKPMNEIRRQVQVYMQNPKEGW